MTAIEWVLLVHVVDLESRLRLSAPDLLAAVLLVVVAIGLAVAIDAVLRRVLLRIRAVLAGGHAPMGGPPARMPGVLLPRRTHDVPLGGRGPRAPGSVRAGS